MNQDIAATIVAQMRTDALVAMAVRSAIPRAILAAQTAITERRVFVLASDIYDGNWFHMDQSEVHDGFWYTRTDQETLYVTDTEMAYGFYDLKLRHRSPTIHVNGIRFIDDQGKPSFLITSLADSH